MKKKTRNIILIIIGIIVLLFLFRLFYRNFDFEKDKQTFIALISKAGSGKVINALDEMRELESLTNPIINFRYQSWKEKMYARFVSKNEIIVMPELHLIGYSDCPEKNRSISNIL